MKQNRKTKARQAEEIRDLNVQIGRLEDRDTQQQAFATLICHPVQTAKLLPRILAYTCLRLRDGHAKTTDACVILVSALTLYVCPCPTVLLPPCQPGSPRRHGDNTVQQPFEAIAAIFAREANAIGEAATRCLCSLLNPVDFDGVSVPGPTTIQTHATRIHPFFKIFLADTVAKLDGSTLFAIFSPLFLVLQSACQLAQDAHKKASFSDLGNDFAPYISSIYEAVEDALQCGPRDDWMLRKRGIELLTMLLDAFALQDSPWCVTVSVAKEYFQSQLRVRVLVLAARHDSVSPVREAAIPAVIAFGCLEKLCPQSASEGRPNTSVRYDFVPPNPPTYSFYGKRRVQTTAGSAFDDRNSVVVGMSASSSAELIPDEIAPSFGDSAAGDEALPPSEETNADESTSASINRTQVEFARNRNNFDVLSRTEEHTQNDESFMDQLMDHAAPQHSDEVEQLGSEDEKGSKKELTKMQRKSSMLQRVALAAATSAAAQPDSPSRPLTSAAALEAVATLKQFAAKKGSQARSRRSQQQNIPRLSISKHRMPRVSSSSAVDESGSNPQTDDDSTELGADSKNNDKTTDSSNLELTRAEAALEAAQCGEFELAFRLCIVEDDLSLLRRTMVVAGTPCMAALSNVARNALCTAFLSLLDGDGGDDADSSSDTWLALQWLQRWAADMRRDRQQFNQLDARVAQSLSAKLHEMATRASKSALAAAHVLFLLGE
ncbi:unnamed protein product [Phytophthora fragariaefolia]|uniref:Unnamed protein product n=1 Tax=Phytophthora fragariaefolia TaxID=1490495 RepID=A0A9W6TPF2_9STRA|nr:unnamed protein product [Phytophthora fragariaefolia]